MKTFSKTYRLLVGAVAMGTFAMLAAIPASASPSASNGGSGQAGYNAIPSKVSGNVPSWAFQATQTSEFGDEVALGGNARTLKSMSVIMSSWGCENRSWVTGDCLTSPEASFDVPLTFTIYEDNLGVPGAVLATATQTVAVQYRPSASANCTGDNAGKWYNSKDRTCYNGFAQTIKMNLDSVTLTDKVIWSVKFNTTSYGDDPMGTDAPCFTSSGGCGYDSLNLGVWSFPGAPFKGTDIDENQVFRNGVMETGPADDPWTGYRPLGTIVTK